MKKLRAISEFRHGERSKTGILLVNLGTPDSPDTQSVARYLREFLSDPRVVEIPRLIWLALLYGLIVPIRARKSAVKYRLVWMKEGSPLQVWTAVQAKLLRGLLGSQRRDLLVEYAMRYGNPPIADVLDRMMDAGATRILVLPLYPQYSATTTASAWDAVTSWSRSVRNVPELRLVRHYHDDPAYIAALVARLVSYWESHGRLAWTGTAGSAQRARLVLSFHGLPKRNLYMGDPYHCECLKTGRLLAEALGLAPEQVIVTFQSRFGRAEWLQPYTAATLEALARDGVEQVDVFCPGFPADCLETLEEIAMEGKATFLEAGGKTFRFVPCLNDLPQWIDALSSIARKEMAGWGVDVAVDEEALRLQRQRALAAGAAQ